VPQVIGGGGHASAYDRLQVRLSAPARGHLCLVQAGQTIASARLNSLPERRLSLALPSDPGLGPLTLMIEARP
jgi:hypothetical protein